MLALLMWTAAGAAAYQPGLGPELWLLGFSFFEVAAIAAAVALVIETLMCRPAGMRIRLIPCTPGTSWSRP